MPDIVLTSLHIHNVMKLFVPVQMLRGVEVVSEVSSRTEISLGTISGLITIQQWEGPNRDIKL